MRRSNIKSKIKPFVVHPFLFVIAYILLFASLVENIPFYITMLTNFILLGLVFTAITLLLLALIIKNIKKAGIGVSVILFLIFPYSYFFYVIKGFKIGDFLIGSPKLLIFTSFIIFIFAIYFILRTKRRLNYFTNILNIIALFLFIISVVNLSGFRFTPKDDFEDTLISEKIPTQNNLTVLPDIYYIALDGYANPRNLKEIYDYDNSEFISYLTKKGFYIPSDSQGNYVNTQFAFASSLNMEHITYLNKILGPQAKDRTIPVLMYKNSKVMNFLKSKGYKFFHDVSFCSRNPNADLHGCGSEYGTLRKLIEPTMLRIIDNKIGYLKRKRVYCSFERLSQLHKSKEPIFAFSQINIPHPPYLFDVNGNPLMTTVKNSDFPWKQRENYLNQLTYTNKLLENLIEIILSKSDIPPIIILQADQGPATLFDLPSKPDGGGWDNPTEEMLKERMGIFNTYYLPNGGNELLYDTITPVNTFRVIFNFYFGMDYSMLSDDVYYSSKKAPFTFINVTDIVRQ